MGSQLKFIRYLPMLLQFSIGCIQLKKKKSLSHIFTQELCISAFLLMPHLLFPLNLQKTYAHSNTYRILLSILSATLLSFAIETYKEYVDREDPDL